MLVLEVPNNADGCLGYGLQLHLRRKLMILKSFLLTVLLILHGYDQLWAPQQQASQCSNKQVNAMTSKKLMQRVWFQLMTLSDQQSLQHPSGVHRMMVMGWKRDYMGDDLLDRFGGCRTDGMNPCFLHRTGCFSQQR